MKGDSVSLDESSLLHENLGTDLNQLIKIPLRKSLFILALKTKQLILRMQRRTKTMQMRKYKRQIREKKKSNIKKPLELHFKNVPGKSYGPLEHESWMKN